MRAVTAILTLALLAEPRWWPQSVRQVLVRRTSHLYYRPAADEATVYYWRQKGELIVVAGAAGTYRDGFLAWERSCLTTGSSATSPWKPCSEVPSRTRSGHVEIPTGTEEGSVRYHTLGKLALDIWQRHPKTVPLQIDAGVYVDAAVTYDHAGFPESAEWKGANGDWIKVTFAFNRAPRPEELPFEVPLPTKD